jgi:hypothetical protein
VDSEPAILRPDFGGKMNIIKNTALDIWIITSQFLVIVLK